MPIIKMNDFLAEYKEKIKTIDSYMHKCLEGYGDCEDILFESMEYSVFNGGKRIRSILCMETARMLSGNEKDALPFAAAIEFIHAFSLVHDDLPCMDNADLRRGMPSCHKKYGEAIALLAGDALLNTAFELMADECEKKGTTAIKAMKSVGKSAGVHGMINGQIRDIELMASSDATKEKLIRLIEQKTMALMMTSVEAGALSCGCSEDTLSDLREFAYNMGIAFQIRDDFEDEKEDLETEQNSPNFINTMGRHEALSQMLDCADKATEILDKFENNKFLKGLMEFLFSQYRN